MAGTYFFCLLDERGDDRCKLQLDLPESARLYPLVGNVRAALKIELGCNAAEITLFEQVTKQNWTDVTESDCRKLVDDEAPFRSNLVFVKRKFRNHMGAGPMSVSSQFSATTTPSHSALMDSSDYGSGQLKRRTPDQRSSSSGRRSIGDSQNNSGFMRSDMSNGPGSEDIYRKSRRLERGGYSSMDSHCKNEGQSPPRQGFSRNGGGHHSPLLRDAELRSSRWSEQSRRGGRPSSMDSPSADGAQVHRYSSSSYGARSVEYYSDFPMSANSQNMEDGRLNSADLSRSGSRRDWGAPRPPSPCLNKTGSGNYSFSNGRSKDCGILSDGSPGMPPPPPPPGIIRNDRNWSGNNFGRPRRLSPTSMPRSLPPLKRLGPTSGGSDSSSVQHKFWNASNSRKLEVNQMSLFRLRPGRWAPVVHNLISKQRFLDDLHHVIVTNYEKRGRTGLPFRIDSLGDVCITHDVVVPISYSWKSFKSSRDYKALSSAHRALIDDDNRALDHGENYSDGANEENEAIEQVETTICFIEIGQERLIVFDWYVYALEYIAERRKRLTAEENPPIFYIYGQPRIGKSICILFLAIAAAFCGEVIYYYCDSKIWELSPRGAFKMNLSDVLNSHAAPREPGKLKEFMFAELRIREQEDVLQDLQRVAQHKNLFIIASGVPEPATIEAARLPKLDENSGDSAAVSAEHEIGGKKSTESPSYIFVPPPAWHELYALKVLSYSNISKEEFEFRCFLFGPIPRNLISENGPFGFVFDSWKNFAIANKGAHPDECPAPNLLDGEPPRLATLLLPVDPDKGVPTAGTSSKVMLTYVSGAAEIVIDKTRLSLLD